MVDHAAGQKHQVLHDATQAAAVPGLAYERSLAPQALLAGHPEDIVLIVNETEPTMHSARISYSGKRAILRARCRKDRNGF